MGNHSSPGHCIITFPYWMLVSPTAICLICTLVTSYLHTLIYLHHQHIFQLYFYFTYITSKKWYSIFFQKLILNNFLSKHTIIAFSNKYISVRKHHYDLKSKRRKNKIRNNWRREQIKIILVNAYFVPFHCLPLLCRGQHD